MKEGTRPGRPRPARLQNISFFVTGRVTDISRYRAEMAMTIQCVLYGQIQLESFYLALYFFNNPASHFI
ncbi:hypothetical protein C8J55DRAFT_23477 [Lentinula edodes]|uniref:Uncharacterized protein n=1 Tax=Lentinula lateritia TaxID=40482 RepID=A0A9W9AR66_9AGAR|nr:hypothetical protein C8J55DRAFT_23477 [Lentinula edodes]